jgi:hypothetical protein
MKYKVNLNQRIFIIFSSILVALVSALLNLYPDPDLNFQNPYIHGQGNDDDLISSDSTNTNTSSISSANLSGIISEDVAQHFTISCSDFKKLFEALSVLDIGNEVSEKSINQTTLDDVENIFNIYAGNCSELDEYEFE